MRIPRLALPLILFALVLGPAPRAAGQADCQTPSDEATRVGHSGVDPAPFNDSYFVADQAPPLDVTCQTFGPGVDVTACIEVPRFVGAVDADGFLTEVDHHLEQGTLAETLTLTLRTMIGGPDLFGLFGVQDRYGAVLDVEVLLHEGTPHEVSLGMLVGQHSHGFWQEFTFDVDVRALRFPDDPCPQQAPSAPCLTALAPPPNYVTLRFTGNIWEVLPPHVILAEVDWLTLAPKDEEGLAWRPVLLLHGLGADASSMQAGTAWFDGLAARKVVGQPFDLTPKGSPFNNAGEIAAAVEDLRERIGVDRVHLVGHSKGGIDAREYARYHDDVETLIMLGTPNTGSFIADAGVTVLNVPGAIGELLGGSIYMTSAFMNGYNLFSGKNANTTYVTAAGDHDGTWSNRFALVFGPNDHVVSVASVEGLSYASAWTYLSADVYTDHSGLRYNTQVVDDLFDAYVAALTASTKGGTGGRGNAPAVAAKAGAARVDPPALFPLLSAGGTAGGGLLGDHPVLIDDPNPYALFLVFGNPDDLQVALVDPDGNRYLGGAGAVTYGAYRDDGSLSYAGFVVDAPGVGTWHVEVTGTGPYGVVVLVPYVASGQVHLVAELDEEAYVLGAAATLTATLTENDDPVTGATVRATVVSPSGADTTEVALLDDGANADAVAGDGRYTGTFAAAPETGLYPITVSAEDPGVFRREAFVAASVAASATVLAGSFADHGADTNGDGLYEELVVDVGVDVAAPGPYRVAGTLTDGAGTVLGQAHAAPDLGAGVQTVSLVFDGWGLRASGIDGPYVLDALVLEEVATGVVLGHMPAAHPTAAYRHTDFQRAPVRLTGVTNDYGGHYDPNQAMPYEYLVVEVEVDVLFDVQLLAGAKLFSQDGTFVASAGAFEAIPAGTGVLAFQVAADHLLRSGRPGPYELRLLAAWGDGEVGGAKTGTTLPVSLRVPGVVATTRPYALSDFGDAAVPVELTTFDALVDGPDVLLTWGTASETNNAGFEVEMRAAACGVRRGADAEGDGASCLSSPSSAPHAPWTPLAFVAGAGTTTEAQAYRYRVAGAGPGRYAFRLKQVDHDGAFTYGPAVEVAVGVPGRFVLEPAYPNPFGAAASTIRFAVREAAAVQVALYDALGRRVRVLFDGTAPAGVPQAVRIDGGGLPSGLYLVRLTGDGIAAQRQVLLVR